MIDYATSRRILTVQGSCGHPFRIRFDSDLQPTDVAQEIRVAQFLRCPDCMLKDDCQDDAATETRASREEANGKSSSNVH